MPTAACSLGFLEVYLKGSQFSRNPLLNAINNLESFVRWYDGFLLWKRHVGWLLIFCPSLDGSLFLTPLWTLGYRVKADIEKLNAFMLVQEVG